MQQLYGARCIHQTKVLARLDFTHCLRTNDLLERSGTGTGVVIW